MNSNKENQIQVDTVLKEKRPAGLFSQIQNVCHKALSSSYKSIENRGFKK